MPVKAGIDQYKIKKNGTHHHSYKAQTANKDLPLLAMIAWGQKEAIFGIMLFRVTPKKLITDSSCSSLSCQNTCR